MDGIGLAGIAAIGLGIFVVVWVACKTRPASARGFEVKLPTGGTPVLLKEDNHG
jgi:hypothetical protein